MPNSIVFSNPGASIIRWGDGVAAPYLTLSVNGSTTLVGAAVTGTVTNTGSAAGQWSVASAPADVLISPSSGTLAVNAFAAFTLTALAAGAKVITLSSSTPGATIVGSPASLTVTSPVPAPSQATTATLSGGTSSGTTNSPMPVVVTLNGPVPSGGYTATLGRSGVAGSLASSTLVFTFGGATTLSTTNTNTADGESSVTLTGAGLTPAGSPQSYTSSAAAAAPTGNITQYLTSDGGSATFSNNFSGPTRDKWHYRMGFAWKRANTLGNWLDSTQANEGSSAYASSAACTTVDQVLSVTVTSLVQRWMSNGLNRGFYLRNRSATSSFPVEFYGRTDATSGNRPTLTVVTSTGTVVLTAAANTHWYISTNTGSGNAAAWRLAASQAPAVVRFDLSSVTGTLISATLAVKIKSFPSGGSTGQIFDVFELDPPDIIVPENVASPVLGLANGYADFNAWKASGHASLLFADDFEAGGWADGATAFVPAAPRTLNLDTNTRYARGTISAGALGSADINKAVSVGGSAPTYAPNVVYSEMFGQYHWYMESDFGTTADTAIKIPAMGIQFGYWNPTGSGYWQSTTGNGGTRGTGLRVTRGSGAYEYQGHSVRFLTGVQPTALDDDPYRGWFGVGIYDYNLDQVGPFPAGAPFPYVALRPLQQYCFDIRVKQNTVSGAQDADGNYATANADGIYQVWINGYQVYSKTNYRWRYHPDMGVQGVWIDVYHGGTEVAPQDMHYQVDRVSIATAYIGPKPTPIQLTGTAWTPNRNGVGDVLTGDYGQLPANTWVTVAGTDNQITDIREAAVYPKSGGADGFPGVTDAWGGGAWNSSRLELYLSGGGHGDSSAAENGIYCVSAATMKASRVMNRAALATSLNWNGSALVSGEGFPSGANYPLSTGYPGSMHTYYGLVWIPPATMTTLGLSAPTRGGLFYPGNARSVINLDTGATTKLWWKRSAPDQSYVTSILDGTTIIQPRADFSWQRWSMTGTETTDWAATSYDPAPGTPSFGSQQTTCTSGTQFVYNSRTFCDMQERRECVSFAFTTTRVRYGAAMDAGASDWTAYTDTITLVGAGAADFVSGNFADGGTNMLNGAGARYDAAAGCIWVMGNRAGDQLYKVTGISTNTWTVTKIAGTGALTACGQGTFGKFAIFDRGGAKMALRVSSTSNAIEAMRITA
jgi:hypothetical protein